MTKRRAPGDGAVYRTADGRWRAVLDLGWAEGKRQRRYVSGRTREEVAKRLRAAQQTVDAGLPLVDGRPPKVREWLAVYLDDIAAVRVRPSTLQTYRGYVANRVNPSIGDIRLTQLRPEHLERMYRSMTEQGLASASVLQCHHIVSRALKVALQRNLVARNVATLVDAPSLRRKEIQPLTGPEARKLLEAAKGGRNAARWSVALSLGLRQGEALGLAWDAVDLDAGTLTVRQALQRQVWRHGCNDAKTCGVEAPPKVRARRCPERVGGGLVFVQPKSDAGRRTITLPRPLVDALKSHRVEQATERLAAGSDWTDSGLVFTTEFGRPIDASADHSAWKTLLRQGGVRDARLHDARHTAATLMLSMGVPARVAMQILGHSQVSLTLGTYSHVIPELANDAADRMGAALWA